jgi:precorrin-6B methylase 2
MKKLLAVMIAAAFATGAAYAADAKKEEAKPTAEQCKKDPKMKGCEVKKDAAPAAAPAAPAAKK